jgi:hypothetical protein
MKTPKCLLSELIHDFDSQRGNEYELPKLLLRELQVLAKLLGWPFSGVKEILVVRLLAHRRLRLKLARFGDDPAPLVQAYWREALRDMFREAGIWRSGNKRALAAASSIGATDAA